MMQEVNDDTVVTQAAIVDQLEDAAQTNVTQGSPGQVDGAVSPVSTASSLPPPSQLPASITSPLSGLSLSQQGISTGALQSPPPPSAFVPMSGTPSKYSNITGATPSQMSSSAYSPAVSNIPSSMSQSMPPLPTTQPSFLGSPQQLSSPYTTTTDAQQTSGYVAPSPPNPGYSINTPSPPQQVANPVVMQSPHEASASIDLDIEPSGAMYQSHDHHEESKQGLFGWFSGSNFMNKVVEKTKTLSENVITTLDPGMKEVIYSGGDGVQVTVASHKEVKIEAVRQAFYEVFGRAVVSGMESQPSGIAPQPVGYQAALKGCEERLEQLRRGGKVDDRQVLVAVENFIVEILPDRWYDIGCILLKDTVHHIELKTFTTATPVPSEYVQQAQDETPATYDLRWSGLAITVGQIINRNLPYVNHADWHAHLTGVSRKDMIYMGAKVLAGMYKQRLPNPVLSH